MRRDALPGMDAPDPAEILHRVFGFPAFRGLQEQAVRVFRDPSENGYRASFTATGGDSVGVLALPQVVIALTELFPK